jgi:hypothetical protein
MTMNNHPKRILAMAAVVIAVTFSLSSLVFDTESVHNVMDTTT